MEGASSERPLVTVLVTAYNEADYLAGTTIGAERIEYNGR